jgi:hypothetical protein
MCSNINEVEVTGLMTLNQATIMHLMAVAPTVILLVLVVAIELNPGFTHGRRLLLALNVVALSLVMALGALTQH